jgi:hypothetical protein
VFAFEPGPSTFEVLQLNVKDIDTVEAVNAGLGAEAGDLRFSGGGEHDSIRMVIS